MDRQVASLARTDRSPGNGSDPVLLTVALKRQASPLERDGEKKQLGAHDAGKQAVPLWGRNVASSFNGQGASEGGP